ncbi:MAG: tetratricopeptide repeat protein, partial [Planctomycetota bacterium]
SSLAGQLARRGFTALALERYREALELDDTFLQARIGTARCLVKSNRLPDAIAELQKVLQADADHVEANLIMSQVEIMQGGDGITGGRLRLQRILTVNPDHPEANYLMGTVCEAQGQNDHALNYYKKAARRLPVPAGRGLSCQDRPYSVLEMRFGSASEQECMGLDSST